MTKSVSTNSTLTSLEQNIALKLIKIQDSKASSSMNSVDTSNAATQQIHSGDNAMTSADPPPLTASCTEWIAWVKQPILNFPPEVAPVQSNTVALTQLPTTQIYEREQGPLRSRPRKCKRTLSVNSEWLHLVKKSKESDSEECMLQTSEVFWLCRWAALHRLHSQDSRKAELWKQQPARSKSHVHFSAWNECYPWFCVFFWQKSYTCSCGTHAKEWPQNIAGQRLCICTWPAHGTWQTLHLHQIWGVQSFEKNQTHSLITGAKNWESTHCLDILIKENSHSESMLWCTFLQLPDRLSQLCKDAKTCCIPVYFVGDSCPTIKNVARKF